MMICPYCGFGKSIAHRGPVNVAPDLTMRRHRCLNCRSLFMTAQVTVTTEMAEKMLDLLDDMRDQQTRSSERTPG